MIQERKGQLLVSFSKKTVEDSDCLTSFVSNQIKYCLNYLDDNEVCRDSNHKVK